MWIPFADYEKRLEEKAGARSIQVTEQMIGNGQLRLSDLDYEARIFHPMYYRLALHTDRRTRDRKRFLEDLMVLALDIRKCYWTVYENKSGQKPMLEDIFRYFTSTGIYEEDEDVTAIRCLHENGIL